MSHGPGGLEFGPDGNLYVTSESSHNVCRYLSTGNALPAPGKLGAVFAWDEQMCMGLTGLAFGYDGYLYVPCSDNDKVVRFHGATGEYVGQYCGGDSNVLGHPNDIAFGPENGLLHVIGGVSENVITCDGSGMTECVVGLIYGNCLTFPPGSANGSCE